MTRTRTLSVLVAAFRSERWLPEIVHSVLDQEVPAGWRLELVVGVDGCVRTAAAAKQVACRQLTTVMIDENCGPYVTFNTLMQLAEGERICRLDADDVLRPGFVVRQLDSTERVDLSFCWSIYTDAGLRPTPRVIAHDYYHPARGEHRRRTDGHFVMRRCVWDALGSFRPWRCAADTDFVRRAEIHGFTTAVVEDFLYFRRTHPNSLTAHPDTGFHSPLRRSYQQFIEQHEAVYVAAPDSRWVHPVTADMFHVV